MEREAEEEVSSITNSIRESRQRRRQIIRNAITQTSKLPISDEMLQTYEVAKELERKVEEYQQVVEQQAEEQRVLIDRMITEPTIQQTAGTEGTRTERRMGLREIIDLNNQIKQKQYEDQVRDEVIVEIVDANYHTLQTAK